LSLQALVKTLSLSFLFFILYSLFFILYPGMQGMVGGDSVVSLGELAGQSSSHSKNVKGYLVKNSHSIAD